MKKIIMVVVFALAAAGVGFGQTGGMLNLQNYSNLFLNSRNWLDSKYLYPVDDDDYDRFSVLGGDLEEVDTPLEISLLTYYSSAIINIRPVQADAILPANNPRLSDQKLGAAVMQEMQIVRFLGDTAAAGRHEGILTFITDRGNVTRADIEAYYRSGIRTLISDVVDEEFGKVSFLLENARTNTVRDHIVVLARNPQTGHYKLSYGGVYTNNETKEINAPTLNEIVTEMERRRTEFDQTGINNLRAQAALIPAVVYADLRRQGYAGGTDGLALIKEILTNFFTNPTQDNYRAILGIRARYWQSGEGRDANSFSAKASYSFQNTLQAISSIIANKASEEVLTGNINALARIPADPRFAVFEYQRQ
jgi:hypothetical protein